MSTSLEGIGAVVYLRHERWLRVRARRMLEPADAEDVVHDTFLRYYETFGSQHVYETSAMAWLAVTLRNSCLMRFRRQMVHNRARRDPAIMEAIADTSLCEPRMRFCELTDESLEQALAGLSPKQRQVVEMATSGERNQDIARKLGISSGTVAKRLFDAKVKLRRSLHDAPEHPKAVG